MEFKELIEARRSIRSYKPDTTVSKEQIEEIIAAAQEAPTWKNSQTGRYYVLLDPEKKADVISSCLPDFNQKNCVNAPALIITTFVKTRSGFERDGNPTNELGDEWGAYDLGLQNAYFILKAKDMGLDTLIMGIRDADALREKLEIPENEEVVAVISLGYRDGDAPRPKRKETEAITKIF